MQENIGTLKKHESTNVITVMDSIWGSFTSIDHSLFNPNTADTSTLKQRGFMQKGLISHNNYQSQKQS